MIAVVPWPSAVINTIRALLAIVSPGAISAATAAKREADQRRDEVRDALNRDLEAARYAADRAFRQYDAMDPANRLVANELEARWNKALTHVAEVESKIAVHHAIVPATAIDPISLSSLASDLRTVWAAPITDARPKNVSSVPSSRRWWPISIQKRPRLSSSPLGGRHPQRDAFTQTSPRSA